MNEIIATGKYLAKLWKVYRQEGVRRAIRYDVAATMSSLIMRGENIEDYLQDREKFKQTREEKNFRNFKAGVGFYKGSLEEYEEWLIDRNKRYKAAVKDKAKVRRDERLEKICNLDETGVDVILSFFGF